MRLRYALTVLFLLLPASALAQSTPSIQSPKMAYNYSYTSSGVTFANLAVACGGGSKAPTPPNCAPQIPGSQVFCKDCTQTTSCGPSGTGAWAVLQGAGTWGCNVNNVAQAGVSGVLTNLTAGPGSISIQGNTGNGTDKVTGIANLNGTVYANSFSGADIGAKVNNAITALGSQGGTVMIAPGAYSFSTTIQCPITADIPITIAGAGKAPDSNGDLAPSEGTALLYTGSGDAINDVITNSANQSYQGCGIRDLTLDGGNGTNIGYHFGGTAYNRVKDASIRAFGTAGIEIENAANLFTERYDISGGVQLIANGVGINMICDASCDRSWEHGNIDIWETVTGTQIGIQLNNNGILQNANIRVNGNITGTNAATELKLNNTAFAGLTSYTDNTECGAVTSCVRFNVGSGTTLKAAVINGVNGGTYTNTISGTAVIDNTTSFAGLNGHNTYQHPGTNPTATACGSGPSPSVSALSTDNAGFVTVGGGSVTSCTINFANSPTAWEQPPICVAVTGSTAAASTSTTTSALTITTSASVGGGNLQWICTGSSS